MSRAREEEGFALVAAVVLLTVIMGLGMGLLLFTDNQQRASTTEQAGEGAFNVAEAALNSQVGQLSRAWPEKETEAYPDTVDNTVVRCTEGTTTTTNGCPTTASLTAGYPNTTSASCSGGTPVDPWGSPATNKWTTYVRDNFEKNALFNSTVEATQPGYDANGDGKVWVRSVGISRCRLVTVISLISRQLVTLNFPHDAVSGNWFKVTNTGNKVLVNTQGVAPNLAGQPGEISMRCEGVAGLCEEWDKAKEQVSPDTTKSPAVPSPLLSELQLAALRSQAIAAGTFHSPTVKGCPNSLEEMSGLPAYVEGCGELKLTGGIGNSTASPGFLVLADGTLELKGNAEFFGVIYARNPTNVAGAVVVLGGTAQVIGAIDVDGKGGIEFGSSKANLVYDPRALNELKSFAGATPTRNTFRILPSGQ
jgi:Tfp pilus assembly protein PilX